MSKSKAKTIPNYSFSLVKLGLTPDEAKCYQQLIQAGASGAANLAKAIGILPNAIYRLLASLEDKGFVVEINAHPAKFQAIPPEVALASFSKAKIREIEEYQALSLSDLASVKSANPTGIELITGSKSMFLKGADLINETKKEVLIISIGEPVPDEIKLANRDAIERGVDIKFIAQKYNSENQNLLESWVKMGLGVRHFPGSGYHLSVTDGKKCLLAASNPKNPAERTSMLINSEGLSGAMRNYFYSLWSKAIPIKLNH